MSSQGRRCLSIRGVMMFFMDKKAAYFIEATTEVSSIALMNITFKS